jgi:hypothetical protein
VAHRSSIATSFRYVSMYRLVTLVCSMCRCVRILVKKDVMVVSTIIYCKKYYYVVNMIYGCNDYISVCFRFMKLLRA